MDGIGIVMIIAVIYGAATIVVIGLLIYTIVKRVHEKKKEKTKEEKYKDY